MPSLDKTHLLKVFSGPHVGAEVLLGDGDHVLGSGEDCDVILNDRLIAERHVRLSIHGNEVTCVPLDQAKVFIDGREIAEQRLGAFQYFTVGNTHLGIGPADQPWPNHDFPRFELNPTTDNQQEVEQEEEALVDPVESSEAADRSQADDPERKDAVDSPASSKSETNASAPRRRRAFAILAAIATLAMFSGGAGWFVWTELRASSSAKPPPVTAADIQSLIKQEAPQSDVSAMVEDGVIMVRGYVANRDIKKRLRSALLQRDDNLNIGISDTDSLVSAAQAVLNMHRLALHAAPGRQGEVVVSGEVKDLAEWKRVREAILNDVSQIRELDDANVTTPSVAAAHIPITVPQAHSEPEPEPPLEVAAADEPSADTTETEADATEAETAKAQAPETDAPEADAPDVDTPDPDAPNAESPDADDSETEVAAPAAPEESESVEPNAPPAITAIATATKLPVTSGEPRADIVAQAPQPDEAPAVEPAAEDGSGDEAQQQTEPPPVLLVQRISMGRRKMVTLKNGEQVFEGGLLDNGFVLKTILPDRAVLTRQGTAVSIMYEAATP